MLARLAEIVQEVDMDITTQRQITNKLAEEFGEEVYEYKALIKVAHLSSPQTPAQMSKLSHAVTLHELVVDASRNCSGFSLQPSLRSAGAD